MLPSEVWSSTFVIFSALAFAGALAWLSLLLAEQDMNVSATITIDKKKFFFIVICVIVYFWPRCLRKLKTMD